MFAMPHTLLFIGGNSGIGLATARLLRSQGASPVAAAGNPAPPADWEIPVQTFEATSPCSPDLPPVLDGLVDFPGSITLKPFHPLTIGNPLHDLQVYLLDAVSAPVAFLLSDASRFITGQVLRPDGGQSSVRTF